MIGLEWKERWMSRGSWNCGAVYRSDLRNVFTHQPSTVYGITRRVQLLCNIKRVAILWHLEHRDSFEDPPPCTLKRHMRALE